MSRILVLAALIGLAACASEQQSACMTDEEIAAYRAETGTSLNDAALRAGCQQSALPTPTHHAGDAVGPVHEGDSEKPGRLSGDDAEAVLL